MIEHLLNLASGRHRKNVLIKENEDLFFLIQKVREMFSKDIFVEELGLQPEEIEGFLYFCAETANMQLHLEADNKLVFLEYLKRLAKQFRAYRKLE